MAFYDIRGELVISRGCTYRLCRRKAYINNKGVFIVDSVTLHERKMDKSTTLQMSQSQCIAV